MRIFEFSNFRLDEVERILYRDAQPVALAPKILDILLVLVTNHGHLVTKERLMSEVWRDTFVEENNLTQYIFILRNTLSENGNGKKIIETVPRRGYRFLPEVREISITEETAKTNKFASIRMEMLEKKSDDSPGAEPLSALPSGFQAIARRGFQNLRLILFAIGLLFVVFLSLNFYWRFVKEKIWSPENIKITRLTDSDNLFGAELSPDGKSFAYISREGKNASLRLKNIATGSEIVLVPAGDFFNLELVGFSPDGNYVYYKRRKGLEKFEIFQIPVFGGDARKIAENPMSEVSVSPDGRLLAFARQIPSQDKHQIIIAATDGSGEHVVAERLLPDFYHLWSSVPVWSLDGKTLIVTANTIGDAPTTRLIEIDVETGIERELKLDKTFYWIQNMARLNPDELVIAARENKESNIQLWRVQLPGGDTSRITNDLNDYLTVRTIPNSNIILAQQQVVNEHLWMFDSETNQIRQLTTGENRRDGSSGLCFAPDGKIIYTAREKESLDIYELDSETREKRQLTKHAGSNRLPAVSPDGKFIAFVSDRSGSRRIWIMKRDGSETRQVTSTSNDQKFLEEAPAFSPDGRWIYYTSYAFPFGTVYKIPVEGGEPIKVTPETKGRGLSALSTDGKYLVFAENVADDKVSIAVASTDDGKENYYDFDAWGAMGWMPNSFSLILISSGEGNNLILHDLTNGVTNQITHFSGERTNRFAVSPDGKKFIVSRGNDAINAVLIKR